MGLRVLRRWRGQGATFPVVVFTAHGGWPEKVEAIDAGTDDYMVKPFQSEELLARLRAVVRRSHGHTTAELRCGDLAMDTRRGDVRPAGRPVALTAQETRVLTYLMHRQGETVLRSELAEQLYPLDADRDSNTIEVFVARLRRKLGAERIRTVRGRGYILEPG